MSRYVDLDGLTWDGTKITSKIQEVKTKYGFMSGITTGWLWCDGVPHIDLAEHDAKIKADTIKLLMPWLESAVDGMCKEIKEMTFNGETDWCNENCNNFCEKCVMKWLELKEQNNDKTKLDS